MERNIFINKEYFTSLGNVYEDKIFRRKKLYLNNISDENT